MRGTLGVEGRNDKIEAGKGPKSWKPIINALPSMIPRGAKSECKEGSTARRVGGNGKLTDVGPGGEAQINFWVDGGDLRKKLRERPRGRGTTTRDRAKLTVNNNQ